MYKTLSLLMILCVSLTSCCSMFLDKERSVKVTAKQRDTEIFIDGYSCGKTPLTINLDKTCDHTIVASKPGYQTQQKHIKSQHTMKSASNLIWPLVGATVGTGIGLMTYGTSGYILPFCLAGTVVGGAIGLGVGSVGTAVDLSSRSDCELSTKNVHFNLVQ